MFNIGMENKPYEYTIKYDGIRAPYVTHCVKNFVIRAYFEVNAKMGQHLSFSQQKWTFLNLLCFITNT